MAHYVCYVLNILEQRVTILGVTQDKEEVAEILYFNEADEPAPDKNAIFTWHYKEVPEWVANAIKDKMTR